ncbi:dTMP kinase [Talaromyces islandicus]|uniref:Thymidylate kinase n=1 Tax=Talaromyces islandicus TaxID=28573 RepID=A0A0U1LVH6_TALIS|nr:dTMP kinase [Talaromyces islandicus]
MADDKTKRGALVVVEGLDRAGKSSQCELLYKSLLDMNYKTKYIRFPDRSTPIGKQIDSYLRGQSQLDDHSIHLLFSANRWEVAQSIHDDINKGITVIVDRYSFSGAVYSAAKGNSNLSLHWAWQPEVGLPRPDLCLFLSISPEEAAKRGGYGVERYETDSMQKRVRELFLSLLDLPHNDEICVIDAGRSVAEVAQDILEPVLECMKNVDSIGPLRKLGPWSFIPIGDN